jgi:hypothetical protein
MAGTMSTMLEQAREILLARDLGPDNAFTVLAAMGHAGAFDDEDATRELLIRALDQADRVPTALRPMLHGLVRRHGLYPYLTDVIGVLPTADRFALEAHRPDGLIGDDIVFHTEQARVYLTLLEGKSVVLSAPTSFGKTLVIDAYLESASEFRNVAVIVPTIALMDECRRRFAKLGNQYKVITHGSQARAERNLFVMTQERFLELDGMPDLDFFVVDEFYKLDPGNSDPSDKERNSRLNILLHRMLRTGAQFYLLGPNITGLEALSDARLTELDATFIHSGYTTVATDLERISAPRDQELAVLAQKCRDLGPGTIVYCRSPNRIRDVARALLEHGVGGDAQARADLADAASWVAHAYHPDWTLPLALREGIGIHHGRLPRALGHHMVRLFNERRLPYLLVTSTLIEGVNTAARNIVVFDNKIANKKYDYFTFANIKGRSGRMGEYFVGKVVVFNPEPARADLTVDIPVLSQSAKATDEVLLQLPDDELTTRSRERIQPLIDQDLVALDTLRRNSGVDPHRQLDAARELDANILHYARALAWRGAHPSTEQLYDIAPLLFTLTGGGQSVVSERQLAFRVNALRAVRGNLSQLINQEVKRGTGVDKAIDDQLHFVRNFAQFRIPSALSAIATLAEDVWSDAGVQAPDVRVFAGELENLFLPPFTTVLEEYGLPAPLTAKLEPQLHLRTAEDVDQVVQRLRGLVGRVNLTGFEAEMFADTVASLGDESADGPAAG